MDPYRRQRGQADSAADSQQHRYSHSQSQQRLPPFRTLLSENRSNEQDQAAYNASIGHSPLNGTSAKHQSLPSSSRPPGASSTPSRPPPMPSLSQGFDEFSTRYPDQTAYPQAHLQRPPEYPVGTNTASPYADTSTQYSAQPLSSNQFDSYQSMSSLPPIGELQDRRNGTGRNNSGNGSTTATSFPTDSLGNGSDLGLGSEHIPYGSRRHPSYDQSQGSRDHPSYPALGSGHVSPAADYPKYGQPGFQPSSRGYPSIYGDTEYSSQPLDGSQQGNFGVLGDSNDPRSKRRRGNLPKQVTDILRAWFHEHLDHPYPTEEDKQMFIARTGLSISQISNWFINARRRQLPSLRNQVRSQEHGRASHPHMNNDRDHFSCHESSLSPR